VLVSTTTVERESLYSVELLTTISIQLS